MRVTITVEVDERGRLTVPHPARRALGVVGEEVKLTLDIRVLLPEDAQERTGETSVYMDERGRLTIKPPELREELGIRGRESICEITLEKTYGRR